jgi:hypothetical protein
MDGQMEGAAPYGHEGAFVARGTHVGGLRPFPQVGPLYATSLSIMQKNAIEPGKARATSRRKFLRVFPQGFADPKYLAWERDYKWEAHQQWQETLDKKTFSALLAEKDFPAISQRAMAVESRTNLLFSFEKMALRDAVKEADGARTFALALYDRLYASRRGEDAFERLVDAVESLPRKQTRVLTWPLVTVFGFIARPEREIFLKPQVTKAAAAAYGRSFDYRSRPNWDTYADMLEFAAELKEDLADLQPRDMIDIQSFIWVLGSPEYA